MIDASLLRILEERAQARALLFAAGEFGGNLERAIAPLWHWAQQLGLVEQVGETTIKAIIESPFERVIER
jgi:hypothetical protein